MSKAWSRFLTIFCGGVGGGVIMLDIFPNFWWLGAILGSIAGFVISDFGHVISNTLRACKFVSTKLPKRDKVRIWFWTVVMMMYMLIDFIIVFVPGFLVALLFLNENVSDKTQVIMSLIGSMMVIAWLGIIVKGGFCYAKTRSQAFWEEFKKEKKGIGRCNADFINPALVALVYPRYFFRWLKAKVSSPCDILLGGFIVIIAITGLIWTALRRFFRDKRLVYSVFLIAGVVIGYFVGSGWVGAGIGAIIAIALGKCILEMVSPRLTSHFKGI